MHTTGGGQRGGWTGRSLDEKCCCGVTAELLLLWWWWWCRHAIAASQAGTSSLLWFADAITAGSSSLWHRCGRPRVPGVVSLSLCLEGFCIYVVLIYFSKARLREPLWCNSPTYLVVTVFGSHKFDSPTSTNFGTFVSST